MKEPVQKVLILNQFAWPDAAATAQLLDDVVRSLGTRDDVEITIVAGAQSYRQSAQSDPPPAKFVRIPGPPVGRSRYGRLLAWMTYYAGVLGYCALGPRHDLVISMTTPPLLSFGGWLAQQLRGSRHAIWEMDIYPDIMEAAGMVKKGSWLTRMIRKRANKLRSSADAVMVLGECMKRRLAEQGVPEPKMVVCENWAPFRSPVVEPDLPPMRPIRMLYSGNLGVAHDIETIQGALLRLSKLPDSKERFELVVAADGGRRRSLEEWCSTHKIDIVHFVPMVDRDKLGSHLSNCHLGLVTQTAESLGCVVPSKFYGLLAAGRPVIYVGPATAEVARVIDRTQCGFHVHPGDANAMVDVLLSIESSPNLLRTYARRAAFLGSSSYSTAAGVARIQAAIAPLMKPATEPIPSFARQPRSASVLSEYRQRVS
jgi:colanic acid biosynthesis glycosyl transferase WcaI